MQRLSYLWRGGWSRKGRCGSDGVGCREKGGAVATVQQPKPPLCTGPLHWRRDGEGKEGRRGRTQRWRETGERKMKECTAQCTAVGERQLFTVGKDGWRRGRQGERGNERERERGREG